MTEEPDWIRPVVHWEIRGPEPEKLKAFYGALFNWPIGDPPAYPIPPGLGPPPGGPNGGIVRSSTPGVVLYIQVRDIRATLARVPDLGGTVTREPFDVPPGVTIAWITDPAGNRVTLIQQ